MKLDPYLTQYIEVDAKWMKDLNIRTKTINLLEETTGVKIFHNLGSGRSFLINWTSSSLKPLSLNNNVFLQTGNGRFICIPIGKCHLTPKGSCHGLGKVTNVPPTQPRGAVLFAEGFCWGGAGFPFLSCLSSAPLPSPYPPVSSLAWSSLNATGPGWWCVGQGRPALGELPAQ